MAKALPAIVPVDPEWRSRHPATPNLSGPLEYRTLMKNQSEAHQLFGSNGDNAWFLGGELNACFNCVDRHAIQDPDRTAIIYEPDDPAHESLSISYKDLLSRVSRLAGCLRARGVAKGDIVTVYMPMIPEAVIAMLACARIGAVHSVVFAGFSAESLRERIQDADSTVVITTDEGRRGAKAIPTKKVVDEAVQNCPKVSNVLVYRRTGVNIPWTTGRDLWWDEEVKKYPAYMAPEKMDSEDFLFLLYTSGSTGKPKGVLHSTAGYLLGAAVTGKYVFDINHRDRFFCGGDIGWITGHTYAVYAPLVLGCTTVIFEGTPVFPSQTRYWEVIEKHRITHFYGAPTSFRLLKRSVDKKQVAGFNTTDLRVLGSVGEPIAPEIWNWYSEMFGDRKAPVTDTYWQTETGSHIIASFAGTSPMKPGSASLPCFGIELAIIDPLSGKELKGNAVEGVLAIRQPWPSMARTLRGDHERYMDAYFNMYNGYYFTGDGAYRDQDGYYWIRGRVDDVINVSGHRLSTSEIESALLELSNVAEAAIIGVPDELTGQAINAVVSLKATKNMSMIEKDLVNHVRRSIGPFAAPKRVVVLRDLPKTRSGKILRRILRKALTGETEFGDISTLADSSVVEQILGIIRQS